MPHEQTTSLLSSERLKLLYQLTRTFNSSLDLDEVLNRVMDEVIAALHAERGFVMLGEPDGEMVFRIARGMDQRAIADPQFQVSRSIVVQVSQAGQAVLTSDAQIDSRFSDRRSVMSLGLRSILCAPLKIKERVIGVIYVDNRLQAGIFSEADLALLDAIASNAAVAIENARLYQIAVEKGRMERELQMAHQVQAGLLPRQVPQIPGWDFAASWYPAREVAGDYYDFIPSHAGQIGLVIADVTDKGMPASLFMVFTRSVMRAATDQAASPLEVVKRTNRLICRESNHSLFVTLFLAWLDPATGTVGYVNAGHNPALHYEAARGRLTDHVRTGMPLGIEGEAEYRQKEIQLAPGDVFVLYTDGITEAIDPAGREFGVDHLQRLLLENRQKNAAGIVKAAEQAINAHTGPGPSLDDITMVVVKRQ